MTEKITTLILTYNEEIHIKRCIKNAQKYSDRIIVVDSFSSDQTLKYLPETVEVYQNEFSSQGQQVEWALNNITFRENEVILRLDADEYLDEMAINSIRCLNVDIADGWSLNRRIYFLGSEIRFGRLQKNYIVRVIKFNRASCDGRIMDEHFEVFGHVAKLRGKIIDDNLDDLTFWLSKHINYAKREAIMQIISNRSNQREKMAKRRYYYYLPKSMRSTIYYIFRMSIGLGILGRKKERYFHFLQGYWYRSLVDVFIYEYEQMGEKNLHDEIKKYS